MTITNKKELSGPHLKKLGYDGIRYGMNHSFLSKEFLAKAMELYDRAEGLAENEQVLHRIQRDRLSIMHVKLARGPELVGDEYDKILNRFEKIARLLLNVLHPQGSPDLEEKLVKWRKQYADYHTRQ